MKVRPNAVEGITEAFVQAIGSPRSVGRNDAEAASDVCDKALCAPRRGGSNQTHARGGDDGCGHDYCANSGHPTLHCSSIAKSTVGLMLTDAETMNGGHELRIAPRLTRCELG